MSSAWLPIRTVNLMGAPPYSWLHTISIGRSPAYFSFNNRLCYIIVIPWEYQLKTVNKSRSISGSDIHVMLDLCRCSRQIVVADEELNSPDMVGELLGK